MNKVVAVVAQPCQILYVIIFSILVYVMHREHTSVSNLAAFTYDGNFMPSEHTSVGV